MNLFLAGCSIFDSINSVAELTKETTDSLKVIAKNLDIDTKVFSNNIIKSTENVEKITESLRDTAIGIEESTGNISKSTQTMAETAKTIDKFAKSLNKTTVNANQKIDKILSGIDAMVRSSKQALKPLKEITKSSGDITHVIKKSMTTADQLLTNIQKFTSDDGLNATIKSVESISKTVDSSLKNLEKITINAAEDYKNLGGNINAITEDVKGEILEDFKRLTTQIIKTLKNPTWYGPWLVLFILLIIFYIFSTRNKYKFQKLLETKANKYIDQAASVEGMNNLLLLSENIQDNAWKNIQKTTVIKSNLLQLFEQIIPNLVHLTSQKENKLFNDFISDIFVAKKRNLDHFNLENINLENKDFSNANMLKVNLSHANLSNINMENAKATKGIFVSANLQNANLQNANLKNAKFKNANLSGANLRGANLSGASLKNANLQGADLRNANMKNTHINKTNFEGANLDGTNMAEANARTEESGLVND